MNSLRITRIGPYEIVSSIGAGGTRLNRDVAIKPKTNRRPWSK